MKKLLKFSDWYDDEFPVMGFTITDQEGWDVLQDICKDIDNIFNAKNYNHYLLDVEFGTNQVLLYRDAADVLDHIEVTDISEQQAEMIKSFFGETYGFFPGKFLADYLHDLIVERDMQ